MGRDIDSPDAPWNEAYAYYECRKCGAEVEEVVGGASPTRDDGDAHWCDDHSVACASCDDGRTCAPKDGEPECDDCREARTKAAARGDY